ncbi:MAG: flagellar basal-body rod protein FlgG [Planctomycetota bacterium]|jgi:flagellar basal-body rod protein FlgG
MLKSLYTTATGMKAQQTMIDTIAHNIANVNTAGFKRSQATFEDLLYVTLQAPGLRQDASGTPSPIGLQIGSGARLAGTTKIYTAGLLEGTNRTLDVAIDGQGFFQIRLPNGQEAYTRDGHLQVNSQGRLVTASGHVLQPEITLPQDVLNISIGPDGQVTGRVAGTPNATQIFGQINLFRFINPSGLLSEGGNVVRETSASGTAITATPGDQGAGTLRQSFIERSNVQIVNELVNLIVAQRAYEVNSRAIQASDQMLQVATSIIR